MSEAEDRDSKTEEATERRLQRSIEQGDAPVTREAAVAAGMLAAWGVLALLAGSASVRTARVLALAWDQAGTARLTSEADARVWLLALAGEILSAWALPLLLVGAAGAGASLAQSRQLFVAKRLAPDFARLSPVKGMSRLLGKANLAEFVKAVFKLALLSVLTIVVVKAQWPAIVDTQFTDALDVPNALSAVVLRLLGLAALALLVMAAMDAALARFLWRRRLRMSKQEVRDEMKEQDGDPALAARRKAIARSRLRKRLAAVVPRATVVIANPTHYAVALRYVAGDGGAPVVVAKGLDFAALTIRQMAEAHGIPVVENKPLARSLHDRVSVDQQIPAEFYRAIADVLILLQRRGRVRLR